MTVPGEVLPQVPAAKPAADPKAAVTAVLTSEQRMDRAGSYALVDDQGRGTYKDLPAWIRRRNELPPITRFEVQTADASKGRAKVVALVEHVPGLDPFLGLQAASERQTWTAVQVTGGWLLDGDPDIEPILPPDAAVPAAVSAWASAVQACDQAKARGLQAVDALVGDATPAQGLCGASGAVTVGPAGKIPAGPASAAVIAQYTSDALEWGRSATVTAPVAFGVLVAPIGAEWKVIAVYET